ncbi:MAG: OmpA family protein [Flavobacteriales bacterium]|nr:OmpA family protein [Flavobacteriales bacterium]MCB9364442.1 OmpA family protein [Flavobacteriales bacterium]
MISKKIKRVVVVFSVFGLLLGNNLFAQLSKANTYFTQEKYADAIVYYNKTLKKDQNNVEAVQNIAYSYRKLKDYVNAEIYYAKATEINPEESANYLYYGQTLKNNDKVREAKVQFEKFLTKNPSSLIGELMVQSCVDIKDWEVAPKEFTVSTIENINSENADFCPLTYEDGIVFVSERGPDLVNENNFGGNNKPYLSIFYAKKSKSYKKAKHFSNQLNSVYHDGPVSISSDNKTIYFTRVVKEERGKDFTNKIKVFTADLEGKKWKNIKELKYSSNKYSVAHPWISEDGTKLFFASDMPGGYGKMDIYVCNREGNEWGEPINLGKEVNTSENEVFPYYRKDVLYFSSDGLSGYGGLDIFSVFSTDNWANPKNLKTPLNSSKDDFGIFFTDDENGYFSSDREGGMGSDDIYKFNYQSIEEQTAITGLLEYDKLPASNTEISLFDENDDLLQTTTTDENGKFKFNKLKMDESYFLKINEEDESLLDKAKLYLTNSNGEKVLLANDLGKGKYNFQALPYDKYDELPLLEEEDESLLTVSVFGQLYEKLPGDYSGGMEVWVVDDNGNIIGKAKTDKDGKFVFDKLSPDEQYLFMLAEDDSNLNLIIIDENGRVLEAAKRLIDGKYRYVRLNSEQNMITLINELDEVIKIAENENFVISKIFYDYKSSDVNVMAAKELDKLVVILNKNNDVRIELTSHTDSKGGNEYNLRLSHERAQKARSYIIAKGINSNRITAKGLGETQPVAPNENKDGTDNPAGRAKNRRTEFKIIKSR